SVEVIASGQFITGADAASLDRNREIKRRALAFLYSTPAYHAALEPLGLRDRGEQLHELSRSQAWEAMPAIVDDEMLEAIAPQAAYPQLAAVIAQRYADHADGLVLTPPTDSAEDSAMAEVIAALRVLPGGSH
ncbi:MAG: LLM class F420-dependent oxidoreductase, partial [Mycobacteriaceae bacterium]